MRNPRANGRNIVVLRDIRGLTQEQLAISAGCSVRSVYNAEEGREMRRPTLVAIARALGVTLADVSHMDHDSTIAAQEMSHRRLLEEIHAAIDADDDKALLCTLQEDILFDVPWPDPILHAGVARGHAEFLRFRSSFRVTFDRPKLAVTTSIVTQGDEAFWSFCDPIVCKRTGVWVGGESAYHYRFRNGKVASIAGFLDTAAIRDALIVQSPATGEFAG